MSKRITIGIPTFKRPREVFTLIRDLLSEGVSEFADIIVIDDGPTAETANLLEPMRSKIKFVQHDTNQGISKTFAEFFWLCQTEYLMITADDDEVLSAGVREVADFALSERPDFVSTAWLRDARTKRRLRTFSSRCDRRSNSFSTIPIRDTVKLLLNYFRCARRNP